MANTSSPSRVAGKVIREVTIKGEKYILSQPQKVGIFADQEAVILSRRLDPVIFGLRAMAQVPADRQSAVWQGCAIAASSGIATAEEWAAFDHSHWKGAFFFWQALDPKHKGDKTLTEGVRWAADMLYDMRMDKYQELLELVMIVNQEHEIKNSSGPTGTEDLSGSQLTESPITADGPPSTSGLESATT